MSKFLFVPMGETFRYRLDGNHRGRGTLESYDLQIKASQSHIDLLNVISNDYECDIFYHFYSMNQQYDSDLIDLYKSSGYNVSGFFTENLIGEVNFYNKTYTYLTQKKLFEYEYIFFIRVDFFLKPYFKKIYNYKDDRILFAHVNEICRGYHSNHYNEPSVNYMMLHVPKKFFNELLSGKIMDYHGSYSHCLRNGISSDDLWFMVETYHSSNSEYVWNPIFHQVGRPESKEWLDRGYRVNHETRQPYFVENETIYSDLDSNDFYD